MKRNSPNCHKNLIVALENKTGEKFPDCLLKIKFTGKIDKKIDNCECSVSILYRYHFIYNNVIPLIIGSVCQKNILLDLIKMETNPEIIDYWRKQIEFAEQTYNKKYKKCKVCKTEWTHNRCFNKGLCIECRNKRNEIGEIKIILKKHLNKTIKNVFKDDPLYIKFCSENKTRQTEEFKEYLKYV